MIAFYLSSTHQTKIPKSLTKRNFKRNTYIPPVIFLYSNKIDVKDIMGNDSFFLPEISNKYIIKARYKVLCKNINKWSKIVCNKEIKQANWQ
jgi:hypothetical protein